jgi:hypothetical protein
VNEEEALDEFVDCEGGRWQLQTVVVHAGGETSPPMLGIVAGPGGISDGAAGPDFGRQLLTDAQAKCCKECNHASHIKEVRGSQQTGIATFDGQYLARPVGAHHTNHSLKPNVCFEAYNDPVTGETHCRLKALREISEGEHVLVKYGTSEDTTAHQVRPADGSFAVLIADQTLTTAQIRSQATDTASIVGRPGFLYSVGRGVRPPWPLFQICNDSRSHREQVVAEINKRLGLNMTVVQAAAVAVYVAHDATLAVGEAIGERTVLRAGDMVFYDLRSGSESGSCGADGDGGTDDAIGSILNARGRGRSRQYQVRWVNEEYEDRWVPYEDLEHVLHAKLMVAAYESSGAADNHGGDGDGSVDNGGEPLNEDGVAFDHDAADSTGGREEDDGHDADPDHGRWATGSWTTTSAGEPAVTLGGNNVATVDVAVNSLDDAVAEDVSADWSERPMQNQDGDQPAKSPSWTAFWTEDGLLPGRWSAAPPTRPASAGILGGGGAAALPTPAPPASGLDDAGGSREADGVCTG